MSEDIFREDFPLDPYSNEDDIKKWKSGETIVTVTDTSRLDRSFPIPSKKPVSGWYKIVASTKDKFGESVTTEKYVQVSGLEQDPIEVPLSMSRDKESIQPTDKTRLTFKTGFKNVWLIETISKMDRLAVTSVRELKNSISNTEIQADEADRGGIGVDYAFIKNNRFYNGFQTIAVPWDNKDLQIRFETFRDKLLPGKQESWKVKISGPKSSKVAAEALINMYDASLDQFKPHNWNSLKTLWPGLGRQFAWVANTFQSVRSADLNNKSYSWAEVPVRSYDRLLDIGWLEHWRVAREEAYSTRILQSQNAPALSEVVVSGMKHKKIAKPDMADDSEEARKEMEQKEIAPTNSIQPRKNFNETAFFFPALHTDADGSISFSFTMPEALTTWKLMTSVHTKEMASGYDEKKLVTQKPLMVQPNTPRFVREGDRLEFVAKLVNLDEKEIAGTAKLELFDALSGKIADGSFKNLFPVQHFSVSPGQSAVVHFPVDVPVNFNSALTWRITASSADGNFTDGEESIVPVLSNRMLVTETMPLNLTKGKSRSFSFKKLLESGKSASLTQHGLTIEYTTNPAWYAVQALPYLAEYPYECSEQQFNRYYANALAASIANKAPRLKAIFEQWRNADTAALLSNLEKNQELKTALLQETPWILDSKSETDQKKNIAILFDLARLAGEKTKTLNALKEMQSPNGGFSWFKGGRDDQYITQYIVTGIGHLQKLNSLDASDLDGVRSIVLKALPYLDARLKEEYDQLKKQKTKLDANNLSYTAIQYLYMRSFFPDVPVKEGAAVAYRYYTNQSEKYWLGFNKYLQSMIALSAHRKGNTKTPRQIIASLKENAIYSEDLGMYFKELTSSGYYWHQAPIESQALIIEAFTDIEKNAETIDGLKTWLLRQKQVQNWGTTRATSEACYALLLQGNDWLVQETQVQVRLGETVMESSKSNSEAGTGYFKTSIAAEKVSPAMGNITVTTNRSGSAAPSSFTPSWGAIYWQYFEDIDKITSASTEKGNPFKLSRKLFIEELTEKGPVLRPITEGMEVKVGDKIKVRIELSADRAMEYIHLKDLRAAGTEPVNVLSGFKWQGGLGYYESTTDAGTNFFFNWLPRGSYVFEYPLFVTHNGNFSMGLSTIQCMYAPEFTAHSEGVRINVAN